MKTGVIMEELYRKIVDLAITKKASDIFIEPEGSSRNTYGISLKSRNTLMKTEKVSFSDGEKLINFIKIKGRIPGDGLGPKEGYFSDDQTAFRVTCINGCFGQVLSLRSIYREPFADIFYDSEGETGNYRSCVETFSSLITDSNRISIICGQPSQGKTTTLFYLLGRLIEEKKLRVISYEEPIEFILDTALQFNRNEFCSIDVKSIYKYLLRMSPDLLVIGEIREDEDWDLAMRIYQSGIPVFSTLHGGDIEQVKDHLALKGFARYNILFQNFDSMNTLECMHTCS